MFYKGPSEDVFTWRGFFEPSEVTSSVRAKACPYRIYIQPLRGFFYVFIISASVSCGPQY